MSEQKLLDALIEALCEDSVVAYDRALDEIESMIGELREILEG